MIKKNDSIPKIYYIVLTECVVIYLLHYLWLLRMNLLLLPVGIVTEINIHLLLFILLIRDGEK